MKILYRYRHFFAILVRWQFVHVSQWYIVSGTMLAFMVGAFTNLLALHFFYNILVLLLLRFHLNPMLVWLYNILQYNT